MGATRDGNREVATGGNSPALAREVIEAGYKPIAILHFSGDPTKIFDVWHSAKDFDAAWAQTEKTTGVKTETEFEGRKPEQPIRDAAKTEAEIDAELEKLGGQWSAAKTPEERFRIEVDIQKLYRQQGRNLARGQNQTGDVGIDQASGLAAPREDDPFRTAQAQRLPIEAARAGQFNAVAARLRNMGGKVDAFAKEFFCSPRIRRFRSRSRHLGPNWRSRSVRRSKKRSPIKSNLGTSGCAI